MTYRLADALKTLRDEVDSRWPDRDRGSDGWIGDAAHASRDSDHNPWIVKDGVGVVRAIDIDEDGIDGPWLAEHIRQMGAAMDPRLAGFGYVIYEGQIAGGNPNRGPARWNWRPYSGTNAHRHHIHVSSTRDPAFFDSTKPWGVSTPAPAPIPPTPDPEDIDMTPDELRAIIREEVAAAIGWTRAVAESPDQAQTAPQSKRLADRAKHLRPKG